MLLDEKIDLLDRFNNDNIVRLELYIKLVLISFLSKLSFL